VSGGAYRILVVDDSAFMRKAIPLLMAGEPDLEVVGTARDGQDALQKVTELQPDAVTLDLEMPVMDGMAALARIMAMPPPRPVVLVCSTLTSAGSHAALKAMRLGAFDFICKDPGAIGSGAAAFKVELLTKLRGALHGKPLRQTTRPAGPGRTTPPVSSASHKPAPVASPAKQAPASYQLPTRSFDLVVIGSSTGGPPVLEEILSVLPADFPAPIVIAQHMPPLFTRSLADRMDEACTISVVHAAEGSMPLVPGTAYVALGGKHAVVRRVGARLTVEVTAEPTSALYKPSVDVLFASAATAVGQRVLGIVLTGMGCDGMLGAQRLHSQGALILAQAAETCAVYGMPKAVYDAGLTAAMLTPAQVGAALARLGSPAARAA